MLIITSKSAIGKEIRQTYETHNVTREGPTGGQTGVIYQKPVPPHKQCRCDKCCRARRTLGAAKPR